VLSKIAIIAIAVGVGFVLVAILSFVPVPNEYNVTVSVSSYEVGVLVGTIYGISGVSGSTTGPATVIDWTAIGLAFAFGISGSFTMTVCLNGPSSHCTSKSQDQWFASVPILGSQVTATNSFQLAYVPSGSYSISVTLTDNGANPATGSGSMTVG
jgi:hypothetical protein